MLQIVAEAVPRWEDEVLVLRELLGIVQTLCWDARCVRSVLQTETVTYLVDLVRSPDAEVSTLALASLANVLSFSDTVLLTDSVNVEVLCLALPVLMDLLRRASNRSHRFYAIAAIANACYHPRLQSVLRANDCLDLAREVERQSLMNLHEVGSKMSDCARTATLILADKKDPPPDKQLLGRYSFKWGAQPTMELLLASYGGSPSAAALLCMGVWFIIIIFTLLPLAFV